MAADVAADRSRLNQFTGLALAQRLGLMGSFGGAAATGVAAGEALGSLGVETVMGMEARRSGRSAGEIAVGVG